MSNVDLLIVRVLVCLERQINSVKQRNQLLVLNVIKEFIYTNFIKTFDNQSHNNCQINPIIMEDDDLTHNLIGQGKKGSQNYQKKLQEIQTQIQVLRNKNNILQKQSDNDIDDQDIKKEIYQQSKFIEAEIGKLKKLLETFAQQFKDPTAKNKLKDMWKNASKQIQRNKIITQRIVNDAPRQSFIAKDDRLRGSLIDAKNRRSRGNYDRRQSRQSQQIFSERKVKNTLATKQATEEAFDEAELAFENQIIRERNQVLNHLQQKNIKINKVMNEIALLVEQQGQNINAVTQNVNQAGENLVEANEELDEAIVQQKKARKKCCLIAVILVIAVIVVLGVVFITQWNNKSDDKQ